MKKFINDYWRYMDENPRIFGAVVLFWLACAVLGIIS